MTISGLGLPDVVSLRVQKLAQDQQKQEGEQAVQLIEDSAPKQVGPNGEGTHINTYA